MKKTIYIFFFLIQILYAQQKDSIITFKHTILMYEQCIPDTDEAGVPCHERYNDAYEAAWWNCIYKYQSNIDYQPEPEDFIISGWASATYGWRYGFEDAYSRINYYLSIHNKDEFQVVLKNLQIPDTLHYKIKK